MENPAHFCVEINTLFFETKIIAKSSDLISMRASGMYTQALGRVQ